MAHDKYEDAIDVSVYPRKGRIRITTVDGYSMSFNVNGAEKLRDDLDRAIRMATMEDIKR